MKFFKSVLILLSLTLSFSLVQAQGQQAPLLGYVKCAPIKPLAEKIMNTSRAVNPSPELEMVPAMMLSPFGYPSFPGISQSDDFTVFIFDTPGKPVTLIMAKIAPNSPVRDNLRTLGKIVKDANGWTIIGQSPQDFHFASDLGYLVSIAESKRYFDIDVKIFADVVNSKLMIGQMLLNGLIAQYASQNPAAAAADYSLFTQALFGELMHASSYRMGISFTSSAITTAFSIKALPDTPLYELFSHASGGSVPMANYFSSRESLFAAVAKWNPEQMRRYLDSVVDPILERMQSQQLATILRSFKEIYTLDAQYFNGSMAEVIRIENNRPITTLGLGGKYDMKAINHIHDMVFQDLMPKILQAFPETAQTSIGFSRQAIKPHNGVPITKAEIKVHNASQASDPITFIGSDQSQYQAIVDGHFLQSSSEDALRRLLDAFKSGIAAKSNIGQELTLPAGTMIKYKFNLGSIIKSALTNNMMDPSISFMEDVDTFNMEPVIGKITNGSGRMSFYTSVPTSTMATVFSMYQDARQSMQQQQVEQDMDADFTPEGPDAIENFDDFDMSSDPQPVSDPAMDDGFETFDPKKMGNDEFNFEEL